MKRLMFGLLMVAAGAAMADDLGDADQALRAKEYGRAFPLYARLADTGNAEAQFRLGEMYWYGDGTAVDMAKSRAWLQKAAAAGHAGARETLAVLEQRKQHAAELAYWTQGYRGEDLAGGQYACAMPAIPALSKTSDQVQAVGQEIGRWETCYNNAVAAINAGGPALKRIPADILKLMTPAEAAQAAGHIDSVIAGLIQRRQNEALAFSAGRDAWLAATGKYFDEVKDKVDKARRSFSYSMARLDERSPVRRSAVLPGQIANPFAVK
jgi:hypothetical protein